MEHEPSSTLASTTDDLLVRLKHVMNQSTLVREIVDKSEELWSLEQAVGTSAETQELRKDISRLEDLLRISRET